MPGPPRSRRGWLGVALVLLCGAVLFLPAVRAPFFLDDYLHVAMIEGTFPGHRSPFDLYSFVDDENRAQLLERGLLPWWTHPELKIRFFRPLASALAWADHRVLGHHALPMHLHSFAWWALAVLAARRLFARVFAPRTTLLATAIFALAPCHALPLAWLANRETLIALAFGITALDSHARWREGEGPLRALASAALFALALAGGGEYALAFGGYVLAIEVVRRGDSPGRRALGLAPFAAPALVYLVVRARLGYGASGSGFYTDPLRDPLWLAGQVPWRAVALLAEGWLTYDVSVWIPGTARWLVVLLVVACAWGLHGPVRRALEGLEPEARARATWLLVGSLLSLAPVLAVVPAMRLLGASALGVSITAAVVIDRAWFRDAAAPRTRAVQLGWLAALALAFAHLVHGPGQAFTMSLRHRKDAMDFARGAAELRGMVGDVAPSRVVVVRGMSGSFFTPFALDPRGRAPARWCVLAHAGHTLVVRKDERTVELTTAKGHALFPFGDGNLFRSEWARMPAGAEVKTGCLRATVTELGDFGPRGARLELAPELEGAVVAEEDFDGWKRAELPAIGFGAPFDP